MLFEIKDFWRKAYFFGGFNRIESDLTKKLDYDFLPHDSGLAVGVKYYERLYVFFLLEFVLYLLQSSG